MQTELSLPENEENIPKAFAEGKRYKVIY